MEGKFGTGELTTPSCFKMSVVLKSHETTPLKPWEYLGFSSSLCHTVTGKSSTEPMNQSKRNDRPSCPAVWGCPVEHDMLSGVLSHILQSHLLVSCCLCVSYNNWTHVLQSRAYDFTSLPLPGILVQGLEAWVELVSRGLPSPLPSLSYRSMRLWCPGFPSLFHCYSPPLPLPWLGSSYRALRLGVWGPPPPPPPPPARDTLTGP